MAEIKHFESGSLLTPQQAADYLGIKLSTVYGMCMRRQIPFCKIGRLNRFKLSDLEAFINQNRCEATNINSLCHARHNGNSL